MPNKRADLPNDEMELNLEFHGLYFPIAYFLLDFAFYGITTKLKNDV